MSDIAQILNETENFVSNHQDELKLAAFAIVVSAIPVYYGIKRGSRFLRDMLDGAFTRRDYDQLEKAQQAWDDYTKRHKFRV